MINIVDAINLEEASMNELRFWESTVLSLIKENQDVQRANPPTSAAWQHASKQLGYLFPAMHTLSTFINSEERFSTLRTIENFIDFHCGDDTELADSMFNSAVLFFEQHINKD